MKRTFEIEWSDDCGDMWINKSNLLLCLTNTCPNSKFTVGDVTDGLDPSPESSGPVNPRRLERQRDAVVAAVAQAWCTPLNEDKAMDVDLATAIIENVMGIINNLW